MARTTLTEKNAALVDALRIATTTIAEQGAKIAALEQQLAAIKSPPPPIATANATQPIVLSYSEAMAKAKRLTAVSGIGHTVQSGVVYRGFGRDRVAV